MAFWFGKEVDANDRSPMAGFARLGQALGLGARNRAANISGSATASPEAAPPVPPQLQQPVSDADALREAGADDLAALRAAEADRKAEADALADQMKDDQGTVAGKIDEADTAAEQGLEDIQDTITDTRDIVNSMPDNVRVEFEKGQALLDAGIEEARTGLAEQRTEALGNVMRGRTEAMIAATQGIQGNITSQTSQIDAQVSSGQLSPAQGQQMKNQLKMGGAMQLGAVVGQTVHAFTQTQAQVASSFGTMFTQMEGTAQQVQGQFAAAGGQAFAAATTAQGQFNTALTGLDAQATANRDAQLSQNAATRATFQNLSDNTNMAMLDYTQDQVVLGTPMAINNLNASMDIAGMLIKFEEFQDSLELMAESNKWGDLGNIVNMIGTLVQSFG